MDLEATIGRPAFEVSLGENTAEATRQADLAQSAAAAALAAAGVGEYADTTAGLAGTATGETFWVDLGDGTGQVYRHDAGPVATALHKFIIDPTGSGAAALTGSTGGDVQGDLDALDTATTALDADKANVSDLLSLGDPIIVTDSTELDSTAINARVKINITGPELINLPDGADDIAVKVAVSRTATGIAGIQAAAGSGDNVDGVSEIYMIAGESATFVFSDVSGWERYDAVERAICAELISDGSAETLAVDAFTPIPMIEGAQMTGQDLSALWLDGGYFTAPRTSVYAFDLHFWLNLTDGPGPVDIGFYVATTPTGSPDQKNFDRVWIGGAANTKIAYSSRIRVPAGSKIVPVLRLLAPITAGEVTTLVSKMTVSEVFV